MGVGKPHMEFSTLNMDEGWETPPGYPAGMKEKILATDLDDRSKSGSRSRFLRIEPGEFSKKPFVHDHWQDNAFSTMSSCWTSSLPK